jgi:guanine nucleotide-binding protein G(i) subunit alpha
MSFIASMVQISNFCLIDYSFIDQIDRLVPSFVPRLEDVLRCRKKTMGIVEFPFVQQNIQFLAVDVGGQRTERKKWVKCFQRVDALCYVISLSDYDQIVYESVDKNDNRMKDALETSESTINGEWFNATTIFLIFNKKDILREKITEKDNLKKTFSDYRGGKEYDNAHAFIISKFLQANKGPEDRLHIFTNIAVDQMEVHHVFTQILDIMAKKLKNRE